MPNTVIILTPDDPSQIAALKFCNIPERTIQEIALIFHYMMMEYC